MQRKSIIITTSSVLAIAIIFATIHFFNSTNNTTNASQQSYTGKIFTVKNYLHTVYYKAAGTIKPAIESNLQAKVAATISAIFVKPNQKVHKDQVLIQLDNRDFRAKVAQAKQMVNASKAQYVEQQKTYARLKKLIKLHYITEQQFDQSTAQRLQTGAQLKQAQKALEEAQIALSYCTIKAPESGLVLNKYVEPGDQAMQGKTLLDFQSSGLLRMVANIPEEFIAKIKVGNKLKMSIDSYPQIIEGKVVEIVPAIDPNTRSFTVKVAIPQNKKIYPGMFGRILIPTEQQQSLAIPSQYIQRQGQLQFVTLINANNQPEKVFIQTGEKLTNGMLEVISGLNSGDRILADN